MITRTVLTALAVAAVAAGSSSTVLITASGNEHGVAQRNERAGQAQSGTSGVQSAEVDLPPCPADVKNHGAYVSSVAKANGGHAEDGAEETDPGAHGALVSAAAQSDCGKPAGADATGDADAKTAEEKAAEKAERDAAKAERKADRERGKSADAPGQSATPSPAP